VEFCFNFLAGKAVCEIFPLYSVQYVLIPEHEVEQCLLLLMWNVVTFLIRNLPCAQINFICLVKSSVVLKEDNL